MLTQVGPMPYPVMNTLLDPMSPRGALNYWKSSFLRGLDDELLDTLVERFRSCPAPLAPIVIEHFHGAVTRVDPAATAVPHREVGYNLVIPAAWFDPAETEACIAWTRETYAAIEPYRADGRWLNYYAEDDDGDEGLRAAYGPERAAARRGQETLRPRQRLSPEPEHRPGGGRMMSGELSTSGAVTAVGPDEVRPADGTPGIERFVALESGRALLTRVHVGPRVESGWHHHGRREVFGHVLLGTVRFEFGPGGRGSTEVGEGGYFQVPVGLVHRDVNPEDRPQDLVIAFVGDGPLVVNVDGPEP